jgi:hypothetical protein
MGRRLGISWLVLAGCGDDAASGDGSTGPAGGSTSGIGTSDGSTTAAPDTTDSGISDTFDPASTGAADDSTSGTTGPAPVCGNDVAEGDEECDGADLAGWTCELQGFDGGEVACDPDCGGVDTSGCFFFFCGDDLAAGREVCDGTDLGGSSCTTEGFDSGVLVCDPQCSAFDTTGCGTCGNVVVDGDEACDGTDLLGETCVSQGLDSGSLGCAADCLSFDTSGCGACGNGSIEGGETCDGANLGGADCVSVGFENGLLDCGLDCQFDTSGCGLCGNGVADGTELCDGADGGVETCVTQGYDSGSLACMPGVCDTYDFSGCGTCGNGIPDGSEDCDDANMIDDDACPNNCQFPQRIVFVSSVMFTGDMGGLLGADAECQALAGAAGLGGTYMAWLSDDMESPATRMVQSAEPYVRVDGVQVAPNWAGLIDGVLDAPINVTELGGAPPIGNTSCAGGGFPTVWTSTASNATSQGSACGNFASILGSGRWGRADVTDGSWTSWCVGGTCDWLSPIYCVQQ